MRIENVRSHEASNGHKTSHSAFLNSKKCPAEQPIMKALITMEKHNIDLMKKLFTTAFFAAKNEKPCTDFVIAFYQFITSWMLAETGKKIFCLSLDTGKQSGTFRPL